MPIDYTSKISSPPPQINQAGGAGQTVRTQGRAGNLGGHVVQQAAVAHTPANGSIAQKVGNFFSALGEKAVGLLRKLHILKPDAQPAQPQAAPAQTNKAQPLSAEDLKAFHDEVKTKANEAKGQISTFLRLGGLKQLKDSMEPFSKTFAENLKDSISSQIILSADGGDKESVGRSVSALQRAWSDMFGSDEISSSNAARRLPDSVKSLLAEAFKAVDETEMKEADRASAKDIITSQLMLRAIGPEIVNASRTADDVTKNSMIELSKAMLKIANGYDPKSGDAQAKSSFGSEVSKQLNDEVAMMQHSMNRTVLIAISEAPKTI